MDIDTTLRALADPTRLRIMRLLATMELAVGELAQVLGQSQPRVSRHVKILCDASLAERRKEGSWAFIAAAIGERATAPLGVATARMLAVAEEADTGFGMICAEDRQHLAAIRAGRETAAAAYFARHAGEWDRLRSLHSSDGPVEAALLAALGCDEGTAQGASLGALLDVGTGTGRIAQLLGDYATHVTGLDKSPEMLRIARARLQHLPTGKADLVLGDFTALPASDASFDTVLFHQVLHYAQAPELALGEAARVTREGGRIAVVDFAAHDREELRSQHAHARLGFSNAQMAALFSAAGFAPCAPIAIPGTGPDQPLTVKIWTGRRLAAPLATPSLTTPSLTVPGKTTP